LQDLATARWHIYVWRVVAEEYCTYISMTAKLMPADLIRRLVT
jgi:hypothetical protein